MPEARPGQDARGEAGVRQGEWTSGGVHSGTRLGWGWMGE